MSCEEQWQWASNEERFNGLIRWLAAVWADMVDSRADNDANRAPRTGQTGQGPSIWVAFALPEINCRHFFLHLVRSMWCQIVCQIQTLNVKLNQIKYVCKIETICDRHACSSIATQNTSLHSSGLASCVWLLLIVIFLDIRQISSSGCIS